MLPSGLWSRIVISLILIGCNFIVTSFVAWYTNRRYKETGSPRLARYRLYMLITYVTRILSRTTAGIIFWIIGIRYLSSGRVAEMLSLLLPYTVIHVISICNEQILYKTSRSIGWTHQTRQERIGFALKSNFKSLAPAFLVFIGIAMLPVELFLRLFFNQFDGFITISALFALVTILKILLARKQLKGLPMPPSELRDRLIDLTRQAGIREVSLYTWPNRKRHYSDVFIYGYRRKYVFLSDYLVSNFTVDEVTTFVAHELGHIKRFHLWIRFFLAFTWVVGVYFYAFLAQTQFFPGASVWIQFTCLAIVGLFLFLLSRFISRIQEKQADAYVLEIGLSPSTYASALFKMVNLNGALLHVNKWHEKLRTHPSYAHRIQSIAEKGNLTSSKIEVLQDRYCDAENTSKWRTEIRGRGKWPVPVTWVVTLIAAMMWAASSPSSSGESNIQQMNRTILNAALNENPKYYQTKLIEIARIDLFPRVGVSAGELRSLINELPNNNPNNDQITKAEGHINMDDDLQEFILDNSGQVPLMHEIIYLRNTDQADRYYYNGQLLDWQFSVSGKSDIVMKFSKLPQLLSGALGVGIEQNLLPDLYGMEIQGNTYEFLGLLPSKFSNSLVWGNGKLLSSKEFIDIRKSDNQYLVNNEAAFASYSVDPNFIIPGSDSEIGRAIITMGYEQTFAYDKISVDIPSKLTKLIYKAPAGAATSTTRAMPGFPEWTGLTSDKAKSTVKTAYGTISFSSLGMTKHDVSVFLTSSGVKSLLCTIHNSALKQIVGYQMKGPYLALQSAYPPTSGYEDVIINLKLRKVVLAEPSTNKSMDYLTSKHFYFVQSSVKNLKEYGLEGVVGVVNLETGQHISYELPPQAQLLGIVSNGSLYYSVADGEKQVVIYMKLPSTGWQSPIDQSWRPIQLN